MFADYLFAAKNSLVEDINASISDIPTVGKLTELTSGIREAIGSNNIVYFLGNGGSAAEATHIAAEFTSHCIKKHEPWGAVSLNDSISALTAIPNDNSFEEVFRRQVIGLVKPGDVVIGLSTSGNSRNVLLALDEAHTRGAMSVLLTSKLAGPLSEYAIDLVIRANSAATTRIQEIHLHWLHTIIEYLEMQL